MSNQKKLQKILLVVVSLATVAVVAVFASVRNQLGMPNDATGRYKGNYEH